MSSSAERNRDSTYHMDPPTARRGLKCCGGKHSGKQASLCALQVFGVLLCLFLLVVGVFSHMILHKRINDGLVKARDISDPDSEAFRKWKTTEESENHIHYIYHMWNISNVDDWRRHQDSHNSSDMVDLRFEEVGGYVYRSFVHHLNVQVEEEGEVVKYQDWSYYVEHEEDEKVGAGRNAKSDVVTMLNPAYIGLLQSLRGEENLMRALGTGALNVAINAAAVIMPTLAVSVPTTNLSSTQFPTARSFALQFSKLLRESLQVMDPDAFDGWWANSTTVPAGAVDSKQFFPYLLSFGTSDSYSAANTTRSSGLSKSVTLYIKKEVFADLGDMKRIEAWVTADVLFATALSKVMPPKQYDLTSAPVNVSIVAFKAVQHQIDPLIFTGVPYDSANLTVRQKALVLGWRWKFSRAVCIPAGIAAGNFGSCVKKASDIMVNQWVSTSPDQNGFIKTINAPNPNCDPWTKENVVEDPAKYLETCVYVRLRDWSILASRAANRVLTTCEQAMPLINPYDGVLLDATKYIPWIASGASLPVGPLNLTYPGVVADFVDQYMLYWGAIAWEQQIAPLEKAMTGGLVVRQTVHDWLWKSSYGVLKVLGAESGDGLQANTSTAQAALAKKLFQAVDSGKGSPTDYAEYKMVNNRTVIPACSSTTPVNCWNGSEVIIAGTAGENFKYPLQDKPDLHVWVEDVVRPVRLVFQDMMTVKGISVLRYVVPDSELAANPLYFGTLDGFANMTGFKGAPVFVSRPNMMNATKSVQYPDLNQNPVLELHDTYLGIEPRTGFTMEAAQRLQSNVFNEHPEWFVKPRLYRGVPPPANVTTVRSGPLHPAQPLRPNVMYPIFWAAKRSEIKSSDAVSFKRNVVYGSRWARRSVYIATPIGGVGILIFIALHWRRYRKRYHKYEAL